MAPERKIELGSVLVVGGCGFLGTHIVDHLLNFPSEDSGSTSRITGANGEPDKRFSYPQLRGRYPIYKNTKVSVADLRTTNNRLPGADYYDADVLSIESLLEVFRAVKPDVVIDTVSLMLEGNKELIYNVNVNGTRNLLEVAGGMRGDWGGKCKAFVYTSSSSVVHDTTSDLIHVDERWPKITGKLQQEYYTETKAIAEDMVLDFNGTSPSGMLTVAIRPAGIYGERDTTLTFKMVEHAAKSSQRILNFQLGDNNNLFDFTYVGNIAYSHMLAAELLLETKKRTEAGAAAPLDYERVDGEAFNITNDSPVYFWDMARTIWALMDRYVEPHQVFELSESTLTVVGGILETVFGLFGKKPRLTRREVRYSCMSRYYSCNKAKVRLGYRPIVRLDEGVARAVGYLLEKDSNLRAKKEL
ncbi:erg26, C-3 sterol dehydrogenase [Coccidioides posadasii str. Silveira]|uniref:C-3 sterol dehydrogenase/C-4 decarboxylase n=3 Tax=Coccidioides posadasii TaxID=199306 RepID=E9CUH8_COCPS|nr:3 beta-hydroxysteroid dehydrogenase, putative [Coccidioides posadasii C735 delta SOWgp]EER28742.1 3 beta-hydroxysteroid dehydrogenase, putative [Coccidioides posadasii C735 delta SOWgp]EFW22313.1 C-3 sterol dehydrogenase/C-4 decarboxylase [Coccidioides posadasii str. Silveira]KMM64142.1 C-3 sterol dehydrogenase/C-4 decarboxylase [Coccidioides posadasii RMSCC 3488]QVM06271.1 erg26, C-3 sterol dehydrogenase [Coccidioides posadasii str. Silveira]|eukprot:XP_003070887.1 3 beta-hydroxysteroid dehydrogenase, putative [Coccidioides posadasii C735 delta SOWgp]